MVFCVKFVPHKRRWYRFRAWVGGGVEGPITIMEEVPRRLYHLRINTPNFKHKFVWFNLTADMLSYFKWVAGFQRF